MQTYYTVAFLVLSLIISSCSRSTVTMPSMNPPPLIFPNEILQSSANVITSSGVALTGTVLTQFLENSIKSLVDGLHNAGIDVTDNIGAQGRSIVRELRDALGDSIGKPILEMSGSVRYAADRGLVIASMLSGALKSVQSCATVDAQRIAMMLAASFTGGVKDVAFWSGNQSFVAGAYAVGSSSRYGIYVDRPPTTFRFWGAFNGLDTTCGPTKATIMDKDKTHALPLTVISSDPRSIAVEIPTLTEAVTKKVVLEFFPRGGILNQCQDLKSVETFLAVVPAPKYKINYKMSATCSAVRTESFTRELHMDNGQCDGTKYNRIDICPPGGYSYTSYSYTETSGYGCATQHGPLGNQCIYAATACPERGGIFCTGESKWEHGILTLNATTNEEVPANSPIIGTFEKAIFSDQSIQKTLIDPSSIIVPRGRPAKDCTWNVTTTLIGPRNERIDFPAKQGQGPLQGGVPNGATYEWNPGTGILNVVTPPYQCEFIY